VVYPRTNFPFNQVTLEAVDLRFVAHTEIESDGRFTFKKVPEGLYKLRFFSELGQEMERTIEVQPAFVGANGKIAAQIDIDENPIDDFSTVNVASLHISPKAADELRRANEAGGNVDKVRQHLEKAIGISPNFDEALNNLGALDFRQGQFDNAAALFQRALKANPDSYAARVNLAGAWIALGRYDSALEENLRCLKLRPDDSLAQAQTGQALFNLKRYDEAIPYLKKAKELDPVSFTLPGFFIAQIRELQGDVQGAIAEYREFLAVHPGQEWSAKIEARIRVLQELSSREASPKPSR
jgi:tetratricopeptide (TPR) repeat protein